MQTLSPFGPTSARLTLERPRGPRPGDVEEERIRDFLRREGDRDFRGFLPDLFGDLERLLPAYSLLSPSSDLCLERERFLRLRGESGNFVSIGRSRGGFMRALLRDNDGDERDTRMAPPC